MKILKTLFSVLFSVLLIANVNASEKWDMALAYGASNFHSANAAEFAKKGCESISRIGSTFPNADINLSPICA